MKTVRTFGVEIELNGKLMPHKTKPDVVTTLDSSYHSKDYGYREIELEPGWKVMPDGSCGSEFVSPPLCDTAPVKRQIIAIKQSQYKVTFRRAGLHVHVGAHDLSRQNLLELAQFCRHFDRVIYSFVHPLRFKNEFCRPMQVGNDTLRQRFNPERKMGTGYRYSGCNLSAYDKHGTIEYRYSESTMDYEKIRALVDMFTRITEYVATHKGNIKVKSPRKKAEKRRYLLNLIGVDTLSFDKLINTKYEVTK